FCLSVPTPSSLLIHTLSLHDALPIFAASLLPKGQTAHSAFKLKLNMTDDDFASTLRMQSKQAQKLRELDFIIWDEISMVPKCALDRKSTRLNSSHVSISYAVLCLKKK